MIFSHFTLSQQVLSESCTFCAITGKRKFAFSTVASFSRQKPLKSKNKNDTIVWNKKFYYCAKFELYRIKDAKVFPSMQLRALSWPGVQAHLFNLHDTYGLLKEPVSPKVLCAIVFLF